MEITCSSTTEEIIADLFNSITTFCTSLFTKSFGTSFLSNTTFSKDSETIPVELIVAVFKSSDLCLLLSNLVTPLLYGIQYTNRSPYLAATSYHSSALVLKS